METEEQERRKVKKWHTKKPEGRKDSRKGNNRMGKGISGE